VARSAPRQPLLAGFAPYALPCGVDEAGRGALAGPVVAAAVVLPPGYAPAELQDSKTLTADQREAARALILRDALAYGVGIIDVEQITRRNILHAAIDAMHLAISNLLAAYPLHKPDVLLVDGNRFRPHTAGIAHRTVIKGDGTYACIAAAGILAKTTRDALMLELHAQHPAYGWDTNKGYPTTAHRRINLELGLTPHHREGFRCLPPATLFDPDAMRKT